MIKDILLKDFIAHRNTKLEFCKGITIFVGHNGSGKSSIIDAITFALFGKHTRKSNKNLIRRGANSAMVQMHFTLNSREFLATRGLNGGGVQPFSQFSFVSDGDKTLNRPIVGGERKQFGESMSSEIAKVLGLDYEKLRVAAVVQQGELVRLVEAQPKEFKELLNGLIGIDRLDSAYETMRDVIVGFRDRLRDETGYTDQELPKVEEVVRKKEIELKQSESVQAEFEDERSMLHNKVRQIEQEIETMEPILLQVRELQTREEFIVRHVNERRSLISTEVSKLERIVREAASSMQLLKRKDEVDMRLQMARSEIDEVESKIGENEGASGELRGFLECAGKLQVVDGKCPVCNSPVTKVNDMFDTSHVQAEIRVKGEEKSKLQVVKVELKKEEQRLAEEEKKISAAEKFLANNSISSAGDIARLEADLNSMQQDLARLPDEIVKAGDDPFKIAIDDPSRSLAKEIVLLREHVRGFKHQQYSNAKLEKTNISQRLQDINRKIGLHQKTIEDARGAIDSGRKAIEQLHMASEFAQTLDKIRSVIFNRDGMVGMSLRSWALGVISQKASEYASFFNIGISRVELAEQAREIEITCYGRQGEIDVDSLSGGEKVAVALALRLGIAYMMGSNKLDFVILDEPTTHLDEERRKALVKIISEAFREGAGPLAQLIIITHDSDIFEDSTVDQVFRFAMTADGSHVSRE
ncbi:MAG: SMC family ATPase [Thaumarchaeota archaeon]|nr:MAG: SMC family ATPase [Nitrososphaerota archaeon]